MGFQRPVMVETHTKVCPAPDHVKAARGCISSPAALASQSEEPSGGWRRPRSFFLRRLPLFFLLRFFYLFLLAPSSFSTSLSPSLFFLERFPLAFSPALSQSVSFPRHFLARSPLTRLARLPFPLAPSRQVIIIIFAPAPSR